MSLQAKSKTTQNAPKLLSKFTHFTKIIHQTIAVYL